MWAARGACAACTTRAGRSARSLARFGETPAHLGSCPDPLLCSTVDKLMHAFGNVEPGLTGLIVSHCRYMNYNGECCSYWLCLLVRFRRLLVGSCLQVHRTKSVLARVCCCNAGCKRKFDIEGYVKKVKNAINKVGYPPLSRCHIQICKMCHVGACQVALKGVQCPRTLGPAAVAGRCEGKAFLWREEHTVQVRTLS